MGEGPEVTAGGGDEADGEVNDGRVIAPADS
jgi:hypothetical protein